MAFLRDRSGAWCPEKIVAFAGSVLPACWLLGRLWMMDLGPRPVTEAIHFTGDWAVRMLWITLAVTPFARIFHAPRLLFMRRTLGVASFAYAFLHISLYVLDQKFDLATVATEIAVRIYLTIGFVALVGLVALAVTSTDSAIRRLGGRRWNRLHQLVYVIAVLALIHFLLQSKNDVWEPILMLGFLVWLLGGRALKTYSGELTQRRLIVLGVVCAVMTAVVETGWYYFRTGVDAQRVFLANFDFSYMIRPAWWVLVAGIAIVAAVWLNKLRNQMLARRKTSPRAVPGGTRAQSAS